MFKIWLATGVIAAAMVAVKDGRLLVDAGLAGRCMTVATPPGTDGVWKQCKPGSLLSFPAPIRRLCRPYGAVDGASYWQCPPEVNQAGSSPI